jgi:transposase
VIGKGELMSTGKAIRTTMPGKEPPTAQQAVVQEALEVTWTLKGHLKNAQVAYLRVGVLLAKVRDKKLYAALHHPDMESYAAERLHLARASLSPPVYKFL